MSTRALHLDAANPTGPLEAALTCQAHLRGHLETTVRVLTPVNGAMDGPQVAVRLGPLLLLIADQDALTAAADALDRARRLGALAFGDSAQSR